MTRSCVLLLAILVLQARSDPVPQSQDSVPTKGEPAPLYPEAVVLVPSNDTADQRLPLILMVPELGGLHPSLNESDPAYNEVQDVVNSKRTGAVILVASLDPAGASNVTADVPSVNNSTELQIQNSTVEEEFIRKRRSEGDLDPLVRKKRTNYGQPNPCMICGMMPQTKQIIINIPILKKMKKKKQPSYYPPPCGYPQCGQPQYHPPPPPPPCGYPQCGQPQYHPPPPPPPPPPQHQPQTCNVCQGGGGYPSPGGSYSHSSSQSSSSSYSGSWGKK